MRVLAAMTLGTGLLLGGVGSVSAQIPEAPASPGDAAFGVARDAFVEGIEHAEREEFRRALSAFERSYRLSGSTAALYNLASTLRQLGRFSDADLAVTRLLAMTDLDDETRQRARGVQQEARASLVSLTIHDVPEGAAEVLVDGRVRERDQARPLRVSLDPGLRVVRVELPGRPSFTWSDTVEAGAAVDANARYAPVLPTSAPEAPAQAPFVGPSDDADGPHWGAILGVGLGVLALSAGGIVIGLVLAAPGLEPRTDLVIRLP